MAESSSKSLPKGLIATGLSWFFLVGCVQSLNGPLGPAMTRKYGVDISKAPEMGTAMFLGSFFMIVMMSILATRVSTKVTIKTAAFAYILGAAGLLFAPNWLNLLAAIALLGIGYGGMSVWYNAEFSAEIPSDKAPFWISILNAMWAVGAVVGPRIVSASLPNRPEFPHQVIFGGACLLLIPALILKGSPPAKPKIKGETSFHPVFFWLVGMMFCYVFAEMGMANNMSRYLQNAHNQNEIQAAVTASNLWLGFMIGRFAASPFTAKAKMPHLLMMSSAMAICGLLLMSVGNQPDFGFVFLGFSMGPIFSCIITWANQVNSDPQRTTSTLITGSCLAATLAPMAMGQVFGLGSHAIVFTAIALYGAMIAISFLGMRMTQVRKFQE